MNIQISTLLSIGIASASMAEAGLSLDDRDIGALYADSKVVVEGTPIRVEGECQEKKCKLLYQIKIDIIHKESNNLTNPLTICSIKSLEFRENYVLFLINSDPLDNMVCDYYLEHDSLFKRNPYGGVFRVGSSRAVTVLFDGGRKYGTDRVLEENFDSELSAAKASE